MSIKHHSNENFLDNNKLTFGTSDDFQIVHDGTDTTLTNATGDLIIEQGVDDKDIILKSDNGSGGTTAYLTIDGSAATNNFNKSTFLPDDNVHFIGNSYDLRIYHSSSGESYIHNDTGDLNIECDTDDGSINLKADNGSGGLATYLKIWGQYEVVQALKNMKVGDNVKFIAGDGVDLQLYHDGTDSRIENAVGNLQIQNAADDKDIKFLCDDGSGGTETYFMLDGSENRMRSLKNIRFDDSARAEFGDSGDLDIYHTGSYSVIDNATGQFYIETGQDDGDILFRSDDGSGGKAEYFRLDGGDGATRFSRQLIMQDNVNFAAGSGVDLRIYHDGTNSYIHNDTGTLRIEADQDDGDIEFRADDNSGGLETYMYLDGGNNNIKFQKDTNWIDNEVAIWGTGSDFKIHHDGSNSYVRNFTGDLYIRNTVDDKDIILESDDGSGGTTAYITLDGSATAITAHKNITSTGGDSVAPQFNLLHDGTNPSTNEELGVIQFQVDYGGSHEDWGKIRLDTNASAVRTNMEFYVKSTSGAEELALMLEGNNTTPNVIIDKRKFEKTSSTDGDHQGDVVYFGGTTSMTTGALYHYKSDGTWELADADSAATCDGLLGVALGAASDTNGVLLRGMVTLDHDPGAVGDVLYVSTTAGDTTATAPSGSGDIVRVIGYCIDASNGQIWFNPDGTFVEVA